MPTKPLSVFARAANQRARQSADCLAVHLAQGGTPTIEIKVEAAAAAQHAEAMLHFLRQGQGDKARACLANLVEAAGELGIKLGADGFVG